MTLLSAFAGGLWVIPVGLLLAALWTWSRAYRASKSGSKIYDQKTGWVESDQNVPIYKTGSFWFAVMLTCAAIASFLMILSDR